MENINNFNDLNEQKFVNSPWLSTKFSDWTFLKGHGTMKHYKKGDMIQSSDSIESVFYIEKGRIRTSVFNEEGEEKIILVVDNGNLFNLIILAENLPNYLCYTALTDCIIYRVSADIFINLLKNDTAMSMKVIMDLSRVVKILTSHVEDMTFMRAPSRVSKCLYMLCREYGSPTKTGIKINIKFTHYEMAIYAGTCRVTISHIMENMEKNNIISKENGFVIVKDIEKLKACITYI